MSQRATMDEKYRVFEEQAQYAHEGGVELERGIAKIVCPETKAIWMRNRPKLRESNGRGHISRLWGKRPTYRTEAPPERWEDHTSLWLYEGKPAVYVAQPYGLEDDQFAKIEQVRKEHGLYVRMSANSWHYTGAIRIEVWASEEMDRLARRHWNPPTRDSDS